MQISVTEFIRPNGKQIISSFDVPDECKQAYEDMIESGCHLTLEYTTPTQYIVCIEDPLVEEDYVMDFGSVGYSNGLPVFIAGTINGYNKEDHAKWREVMQRINGDEPPF